MRPWQTKKEPQHVSNNIRSGGDHNKCCKHRDGIRQTEKNNYPTFGNQYWKLP
jgi:hypothetical protein